MPLRSINLRPALIVAVVLGGAVLLAVQVHVALGLDEPQPPAAASSSVTPLATVTTLASPPEPVALTQTPAQPQTRVPIPPLRPTETPESAPPPSESAASDAEPTRKSCMDGLEQARKLAAALPADDPSRYFAERNLLQATSEKDNGEYDECVEWVTQATDEVKEHRHTLAPGEKLEIMRPDEVGS